MRRTFLLFVFFSIVALNVAARAKDDDMKAVAERYAHLVLALGQHDPDYVDAFYGPAEWKTQAEKEKKALDAIGAEAAELSVTLAKSADPLSGGAAVIAARIFAETGFGAGGAGRCTSL